MNKRKRTLLLSLGVVVVLAALLCVLLLTRPATESQGEEAQTLFSCSRDDIAEISVENQYGQFSMIKTDTSWEVSPYEQVPVDSTVIWDLATKLESITPSRLVNEAPEDLSLYGLDEPAATVRVRLSDGTETTVYVGDEFPDESSYYIRMEGSDTVWLHNMVTFDPVLEEGYYFLNKQITASANEMQDTPITRVEFCGPETNFEPIVIERLSEGFKDGAFNTINFQMVSPKQRYFMYAAESEYIIPLTGLTAERVAVVGLTDEILENAGLTADKAYTATFVRDGQQHTIAVGIESDGYVAVRVDNEDWIYTVKADSVPWAHGDYYTFASVYPYAPLLSDVETITIVSGDRTHTIEVTGESEDDYALKVDGNDVTYDNFKNFYRVLNHYYGTEPAVDVELGEILMTITWKSRDSSSPDRVVNFYSVSGRRMAIEIDGEIDFLCRTTYIDRVLSDILIVRENQPTSSFMS